MADIPPPTAEDMASDLTIHHGRMPEGDTTAELASAVSFDLEVRDCAIRRALHAEAERDAARSEAAVYRQALDYIAAWDDAAGNRTLAEEGRYTSFDYPEAVRKAREALAAVNAPPTGGVE